MDGVTVESSARNEHSHSPATGVFWNEIRLNLRPSRAAALVGPRSGLPDLLNSLKRR